MPNHQSSPDSGTDQALIKASVSRDAGIKVLVTPGEPAGIGPELVIKAIYGGQACPIVAIADPQLMREAASTLGMGVAIHTLDHAASPLATAALTLNVLPLSLAAPVTPGRLDTANAAYVLKSLELANDLCMNGQFHAVVTGPVQKSIINDSGIAFSGHTEFFAERSGTEKVVMMLATAGLRVALATTHLPLKAVPAAITRDSLRQVLTILIAELQQKFALARPRILVAGLNPHAGEGGHLGSEELETIIPVLREFATSEVDLIGPLPADTLFTPHHLDNADAVLAMYHDQGLPVLKFKGFGKAVNITLGLPYIRTSVDHGTALDLAGKGMADVSSLNEAIALAYQLALSQRKKQRN